MRAFGIVTTRLARIQARSSNCNTVFGIAQCRKASAATSSGRRSKRASRPSISAAPSPEGFQVLQLPPGLRRLPLSGNGLQDVIHRGRQEGPLAAYTQLVGNGVLEQDCAQEKCMSELQNLWESLLEHRKAIEKWKEDYSAWQAAHSEWKVNETERLKKMEQRADQSAKEEGKNDHDSASANVACTESPAVPEPREPREPEPRSYGIYIWGGVGGGKSLLMDLLVECCGATSRLNVGIRRVHFHEFMHNVHKDLHELRKAGTEKTTQTIARKIAEDVQFLAFDEFQITNISDALIVETLFDALFQSGVVVAMTSNRPTTDLYKDGLNRHLAIPQFLALLERRRIHISKLEASRDFREQIAMQDTGNEQSWHHFLCKQEVGDVVDAEKWMRSAFAEAAGIPQGEKATVPIAWGRHISVDEVAPGVGRFTFHQLCENALNADDYLQLASQFHTILIDGVPRFSLGQHNEARRFTNLVDCFYERHGRIVIAADAPARKLLEEMTVLASVSLNDIETKRPSIASAVPGGGENVEGLLGTGSSDWIRNNPFSPEGLTVEEAIRTATKGRGAEASGKAGDDDTATGAGIAGVMAGALGALQESGFAARRATSRLLHMQTKEYLKAHLLNRSQNFS